MDNNFTSAASSSANSFLNLVGDEETSTRGEVAREPKAQEPINTTPYREQDIYLPIANVARIMKNSVPQNGKIAKDAKECVQECVSEFISFITSEASDHCALEKRKTINGEDVLFAMANLGFEPYIEPLKLYLHNYRESLKKQDQGTITYVSGPVESGAGGDDHGLIESELNRPFGNSMSSMFPGDNEEEVSSLILNNETLGRIEIDEKWKDLTI